jgi:hypothetical protein
VCESDCIRIEISSSGFSKMAHRNENGFNRPTNAIATITTAGAAAGDNDRSVN